MKKKPVKTEKNDSKLLTITSLRMPNELLNKIKERADKENRNISNMIITALKEIFP